MKDAYTKQGKDYDHNMSDRSPNAGESEMFYDSSASRSGTTGIGDKAGVEDGLGMVASCDVKNAEMVTENQRPVSNTETVSSSGKGSFKLGY